MEIEYPYPIFESIAQRVAHTYLRSLARLKDTRDAGVRAGLTIEAIEALHACFEGLYTALLHAPARFGLPDVADACIEDRTAHLTDLKAELNRKLKKPRDMIILGLDCLMEVGKVGGIQGDTLSVKQTDYSALYGNVKNKRQTLTAFLEGAGFHIQEGGERVMLVQEKHPGMLPALKALASACAGYSDVKLGKFNFARCDFRALDGKFHPGPQDLYRVFVPEDFEKVRELDEYLSGLGYKPEFQIYGGHGWEVQYQGKRKIKASPLVRVEYSERFRNPLVVNIKCASSDRLIPLMYSQSETLRADFLSRTNACRDDECRWCDDKKGLGPAIYDFAGVYKKVCWYTNPDFREFDDSSVALIKEYALLHEQLA